MMRTIRLPVRYYRNFVEPELCNSERNLEYAAQTFSMTIDETAFVLVDCWDLDHLGGARFARANPIMEERIAPVLSAARSVGLTTIHCPGPGVAKHYSEWMEDLGQRESSSRSDDDDGDEPDWPPEAFKDRSGEYEAFAKQADDRAREERWGQKYRPKDSIYGPLEPIQREAEFVVATGEQLHRLLRQREILHLIYVGFNSNFCIPYRDYGMRSMNRRGYNTILLRDCTKAIESHDTLDDELCNKIAIREIERQSGWSALSGDFHSALSKAVRVDEHAR